MCVPEALFNDGKVKAGWSMIYLKINVSRCFQFVIHAGGGNWKIVFEKLFLAKFHCEP